MASTDGTLYPVRIWNLYGSYDTFNLLGWAYADARAREYAADNRGYEVEVLSPSTGKAIRCYQQLRDHDTGQKEVYSVMPKRVGPDW